MATKPDPYPMFPTRTDGYQRPWWLVIWDAKVREQQQQQQAEESAA